MSVFFVYGIKERESVCGDVRKDVFFSRKFNF